VRVSEIQDQPSRLVVPDVAIPRPQRVTDYGPSTDCRPSPAVRVFGPIAARAGRNRRAAAAADKPPDREEPP